MKDGPWMLFDHYLVVQIRIIELVSLAAQITKTLVWIWFSSLIFEFYDESITLYMELKPIEVSMQIWTWNNPPRNLITYQWRPILLKALSESQL